MCTGKNACLPLNAPSLHNIMSQSELTSLGTWTVTVFFTWLPCKTSDFALSLPSAASLQMRPVAGKGSGMTWQKSNGSTGSPFSPLVSLAQCLEACKISAKKVSLQFFDFVRSRSERLNYKSRIFISQGPLVNITALSFLTSRLVWALRPSTMASMTGYHKELL